MVRKGLRDEEVPEGRGHWQERGRREPLAPVFRTLTSSFVGTFDLVATLNHGGLLVLRLFGGWFSFRLVFPLLPRLFLEQFCFEFILDQKEWEANLQQA